MEQVDNGGKSVHLVNVPAELWSYGKLIDGQLTIETSAATYIDKKEDRHCVSYGNKEMGM